MKRWGVWFLLCPTLFSGGARAADINTIVKVEARGSTVEIVGSKQPSFTTFTMTDPPRLVVDIAEAVFSGVPDQQPGSGLVSWIKTASYGSDASAIARVLIAFTKEVETDLTATGGKLVVKIIDAPAPAVARANKPASTARPEAPAKESKEVEAPPKLELATGSESSEAPAASERAPVKQEGKLKEAFAKATQERGADAEARNVKRQDAERQEQSRRAEAEKRREQDERARLAEQERAAEQQRVAQAEQAKREAAAEAKRKAEEERVAREKARAEAEQAKHEAAAEAKRKVEEERVAREQARAEAEQAKRESAAEAKHKAEEERVAREQARAEAEQAKREAAAEAKRNAQEEKVAREKARAEAEQAKREAVAEAKHKAQEERVAQAQAKAEQEKQKREAAAERKRQAQEVRASRQQERASSKSRARRATMTFVGFQRASSGSRVYVRTSGPVSYSVQEDGDKRVVLELENTRIALRNNRRPLDTSFFDSAVAMVAPASVGKGTVRVEIKLKGHASFQAKQDGNEVSVEFPNAPHP